MTHRNLTRLIPTATLAVLMTALSAAPTLAKITTRDENLANPRGWPAVAGMDVNSVLEMAKTAPVADQAGPSQPYCDQDAKVHQTLQQDFGEELVSGGANDTQLWGSTVMGTWTVVLKREDATSCVIASGVGYADGANPRVFFVSAGLNG